MSQNRGDQSHTDPDFNHEFHLSLQRKWIEETNTRTKSGRSILDQLEESEKNEQDQQYRNQKAEKQQLWFELRRSRNESRMTGWQYGPHRYDEAGQLPQQENFKPYAQKANVQPMPMPQPPPRAELVTVEAGDSAAQVESWQRLWDAAMGKNSEDQPSCEKEPTA